MSGRLSDQALEAVVGGAGRGTGGGNGNGNALPDTEATQVDSKLLQAIAETKKRMEDAAAPKSFLGSDPAGGSGSGGARG